MAPSTNTSEDQFLFLISCIKNARDGKPDFQLVAKDRGIISKGAAQKRWSRLMKSHGISLKGSLSETSPRKRAETPPSSSDNEGEEDDAELQMPSKKRKRGPQTPRKRAPKKTKKETSDEEEEEEEEDGFKLSDTGEEE